jgi:hypothetical protein
VLHLFSGKKDRADGLKAQLIARGWSAVDEIDAGVEAHAGAANPAEDLLDDDFFFKTLAEAVGGKWQAVVDRAVQAERRACGALQARRDARAARAARWARA